MSRKVILQMAELNRCGAGPNLSSFWIRLTLVARIDSNGDLWCLHSYCIWNNGQGRWGQEEESTPEDESSEELASEKPADIRLRRPLRFKGITSGNAWSLLIVSMAVIGLACAGLVEACSSLATEMGIAPYFIAVVLASAATSVPDTIISYRDAMDGDYDDAVANALGSNIFDVCFALGLPLFVYTVAYGSIS